MDSKPFIFGTSTSGSNFTDRKKETERLLLNFQNGVNTILISQRRIGKTSLVRKVCALAQTDKLKVVYLDIFRCKTEREFFDSYAAAVVQQTSSRVEEWIENIKQFLAKLNPRISMGTDPMQDFSISLEMNQKTNDADEILKLPEKIAQKIDCRIVVCIDEFQQIGEFSDSVSFQKRLRSVWQLQTQVSYCLFGSKKHLMNALFEKKSLPFYKFGDCMYLSKIPTQDWIEYICQRFEVSGKSISADLAGEICRLVSNHSSYVQQLAWLVWVQTDKVATERDLEVGYQDLLDQNSPLFERQTESLSSYQINFLHAVVDGVHSEFTTQKVLGKYGLGSSANVSVLIRALEKKELIEKEKHKIYLADPVLEVWLKRTFLF